jgi:aminobenzoyl-glutamate utilization protein B
MRTFLAVLILAAAALASDKENVLKQMDARAAHYGDVSRRIWEFAEVGYKEQKSAELLKSELRQAGFTVEDNVAGIPTAFTASWGQGKPVIAVLGEYDALPGLSQEAVPERKPVVEGAPGHGCGHNLLGAASLFAAVSVKDWLVAKKIPGHHPLLWHARRRRRRRKAIYGSRRCIPGRGCCFELAPRRYQ